MYLNHNNLVAVLLIVTATVGLSNAFCHNLKCTEPDGYFSHPQSCIEYVKCVSEKAFVKKCPANLHFNAATGMCDKPVNSQCVESEKEKSSDCSLGRRAMTRSAPVPGIECDCGKCCRKPNPTDCRSFYECDEFGNAHEKTCGEGLVYNPVNQECDLPTNYECPVLPECSCKCRYPVDGECSAFYLCEEVGNTVSKEYCTEGLVFNSETEMCDFSENVECPAKPPPVPENPDDCKDLKPDCKYWVDNGDCVCDPFKNGDCSWQHYVQDNCPASCSGCNGGSNSGETDNGGGGNGGNNNWPSGSVDGCIIDCSTGQQYWPHPTSCEMFVQCAPYGPQEMPCPAGTRWDQNILTCDHEDSTQCVTGNYVDESGNSCGGGNGDGGNGDGGDGGDGDGGNGGNGDGGNGDGGVGEGGDVDNGGGGNGGNNNWPSGSVDGCIIDCSSGQQYWPHPTSCEMFVQCAPYGPQEMPCPAGTRWDQNILTCDHEDSTPCVTGNYVDDSGNSCGGGNGGNTGGGNVDGGDGGNTGGGNVDGGDGGNTGGGNVDGGDGGNTGGGNVDGGDGENTGGGNVDGGDGGNTGGGNVDGGDGENTGGGNVDGGDGGNTGGGNVDGGDGGNTGGGNVDGGDGGNTGGGNGDGGDGGSGSEVENNSNESDEDQSGESGGKPSHESGGKPSHESGGKPSHESGGKPSHESGGKPSHESGGKPSHESGGKPSHESGGKPSHESGGKPSHESGGKPSHESGGKPSHESGGKPSQESGGKHSHESGGKHSHESGGKHSQESGGKHSHESGGKHSHESGGKHSKSRESRSVEIDDETESNGSNIRTVITDADCVNLPDGFYPTKRKTEFVVCDNKRGLLLRCGKQMVFDSTSLKCVLE